MATTYNYNIFSLTAVNFNAASVLAGLVADAISSQIPHIRINRKQSYQYANR
jgi:hypothetical protein